MVQQVRVMRNVVGYGVLCVLALGLVRDHVWDHRQALGVGLMVGTSGGWLRWQSLSRTIARRDRRYERNKIFVHYLSLFDVAIAVVAYHPVLGLFLGAVLLAAVVGTTIGSPGWIVGLASSSLVGVGVLAGALVRYERHHGPVYYQYTTAGWSGAEGLVYQQATVVQPLAPAGKVTLQGVLWNAVSLSGESIERGAQVEVITTERLTLLVDRLPPPVTSQTT